MFTQPVAGLQLSSVQTLPSSQFGGAPPTHDPSAQVSAVVHALPSLHGAVLFVLTQPLAGLQLSSVQPLPSSQLGGAPGTHAPAEHVSSTVQALSSLHGAVLFVCTQPPLSGLQLSLVQGLSSSHGSGAPLQLFAPSQTSLMVHTLPSSQEVPDGSGLHVVEQQLGNVPLSSPSSQVSVP